MTMSLKATNKGIVCHEVQNIGELLLLVDVVIRYKQWPHIEVLKVHIPWNTHHHWTKQQQVLVDP
jgi:hypothetical protein